jgi:hypothetical protein
MDQTTVTLAYYICNILESQSLVAFDFILVSPILSGLTIKAKNMTRFMIIFYTYRIYQNTVRILFIKRTEGKNIIIIIPLFIS